MTDLDFSFIVPVYNRPEEIRELLQSLALMRYDKPFEVVIIEDGSEISSAEVVSAYRSQLTISYLTKPNTGPGDSRNFGMLRAKGNYFLILDSDCLLPPHYLEEVERELQEAYVDCFGGPDAAHAGFTDLQKAINYAMTSVLTTGGIRGGKRQVGKFQPRSFNMGISRQAFERTGGFGRIHPGEDPDLTIRIWKSGFDTRLFPEAYVYHKRRIDWKSFKRQVTKFGLTRPILNQWHPETAKITYWFPTLFTAGLCLSIVLAVWRMPFFLLLYVVYFTVLWLDSWIKTGKLTIAFKALYAVLVQFFGYGWGFAKSTFFVTFLKRKPEEVFPQLFFKD